MTTNILAATKTSSVFVTVGRVSDEEDIMVFIDAESEAQAKQKFLDHVKTEQDWDGVSDIYVEFCIPLNNYQPGFSYTSSHSSEAFSF